MLCLAAPAGRVYTQPLIGEAGTVAGDDARSP